MSNNDKSKKEGEHIMSNYKKQLAEKMAREKINKGDMTISSKISTKSGKKKSDDGRFGSSPAQEMTSNEPPEPEVLLSILHRKSRF